MRPLKMSVDSPTKLKKLFNTMYRYRFRLKTKRNFVPDGIHIYEELLDFYKKSITLNNMKIQHLEIASVKKQEASFLYSLIIQERPKTVLEVGTFAGFSTMVIAEGLRDNKDGMIYTVDPQISIGLASNP